MIPTPVLIFAVLELFFWTSPTSCEKCNGPYDCLSYLHTECLKKMLVFEVQINYIALSSSDKYKSILRIIY